MQYDIRQNSILEMKILLLVLVLIACLCCRTIKHKPDLIDGDVYEAATNVVCKVYEIDSIADYYLLYATNNNKKYKIFSGKKIETTGDSCQKIKVGGEYLLKLNRPFDVMCLNGRIVADTNFPRPMCYPFYKGVFICNDMENGIYYLYAAYNLKGICLCK